MATRGIKAQPAASPCDYCHQKPKFANHRYCSKTCAGQAAAPATTNMCIYCNKRPKFQNFDFCGKSCAATANPAQRRAGAPAGQRSKGGNSATTKTQQPTNPGQVAQFVAQSVPQVKALLAALNATGVGAPQTGAAQQQVPLARARGAPVPQNNNPFLQAQAQAAAAAPAVHGTPDSVSSSVLFGTQPPPASAYIQPAADNPDCLIPGCGKPVHVDANGVKTSDFCSQRHREEAVAAGLAEGCIMCLRMPQSETDYFCSRACREEALKKMPE